MAAQSGAGEDASLAGRPSLTIRRRLNAAPEKVYAAWTDPQKIVRWFGPAEVKAGSVQADLEVRIGGHYRISFDTEDGAHHEVGGVYREVVPNRKLVFSWAWRSTPEFESVVALSLQPDGDGTWLSLQHEQLIDQAARDSHQRGWLSTLDKLERFTA
jgi:uncharacterized protein YndB with AHSA1/START domain